MASENAEHLIEIRVDRLAQLFHTLDPFPFWEKDLVKEAEDYIVSWARELPDKRPIRTPSMSAMAMCAQRIPAS